MGKNPAFQFYPNDWSNDPQLKMAPPATRGIWIDLICSMWWSPARGTITGTLDDLCRIGNCSTIEMQAFLDDAQRLNFADVTFCNNQVTVSNRRMVREQKERESTRYRVQRHRNAKSNASVTVPSPNTPSPSTPSPTPEQLHCEADASRNGNEARAVLDFLNRKAGRNYRSSDTNLAFIKARLKSGIADWQLKAIISRKVAQWRGTEQEVYLRPATLFNKTKCEQYLGELPKEPTDGMPGVRTGSA